MSAQLPQDIISRHQIICSYSTTPLLADHFQMHCHNHYELYYLLEGDVDYLIEGNLYHLLPGTLLILPPLVFHGPRDNPGDRYRRYSLYFFDSILPVESRRYLLSVFEQDSAPDAPFYYPNASREGIDALFQFLSQCGRFPKSEQQSLSVIYLQALLARVTLLQHRDAGRLPRRTDPRIPEILAYLNEHLTENLSLDILSSQFFISKNHLNVIFRQATGTTIGEYLVNKRIILAQQYLFEGYSAAQASALSGFTEYSTFFRAYEKILGHKPSQDKSTRSHIK